MIARNYRLLLLSPVTGAVCALPPLVYRAWEYKQIVVAPMSTGEKILFERLVILCAIVSLMLGGFLAYRSALERQPLWGIIGGVLSLCVNQAVFVIFASWRYR